MAKKSVLIPSLTAAKNIDVYNASFKFTADLDNGNVFQKGALSTESDEGQVYVPELPATGEFTGLWMAFSPEDIITTDAAGNQFKLGQLNPQSFTNVAGVVFSGFKLQAGDIVKISADGISGTENSYVVAADGTGKLAFAAAALTSGLSFKVIEKTYMSIPSGEPSQRVDAYRLECVQN